MPHSTAVLLASGSAQLRHTATWMQQLGGKDEGCSGNRITYGMGEKLVWFSPEWRVSRWHLGKHSILLHHSF